MARTGVGMAASGQEWSIQEIARLAGTTSRTLRHYHDLGLLPPSRVGRNGYRHYDQAALTRLQRILLLRELGLGLPAIAQMLDGVRDDARALETHLEWLRRERARLDDQIATVETTVHKLRRGEALMAGEMFKGFDHSTYKDEVVERWGEDAYAEGEGWWRGMSDADRDACTRRAEALVADWRAAAEGGADPLGPEGQALARRQMEWLSGMPGTPQEGGRPSKGYFLGLAEMYVADARFAATYGGPAGAAFVRDAMTAFAEREM